VFVIMSRACCFSMSVLCVSAMNTDDDIFCCILYYDNCHVVCFIRPENDKEIK